jgi:hypothetical protein
MAANNRGPRLVRMPMAANSRQHVERNVRIDSNTTFGVAGDPPRFGVNEQRNIDQAEALINTDTAGGMRVVTGRNRDTKFSGALT